MIRLTNLPVPVALEVKANLTGTERAERPASHAHCDGAGSPLSVPGLHFSLLLGFPGWLPLNTTCLK